MNKAQRIAAKRRKRKEKTETKKRLGLPMKIKIQKARKHARMMENQAYREQFEANQRAINLKLKRALGIPDEEEVSTQKLVAAMNHRAKLESLKRKKALRQQSKNVPIDTIDTQTDSAKIEESKESPLN